MNRFQTKYLSQFHIVFRPFKWVIVIALISLVFHSFPTHSQHKNRSETLYLGNSMPRIALTFDDGPSPSTNRVLDILQQHQIRATFFVVGKNAEHYPDIVSRIQHDGHLIGSHTYSHSPWSSIKTPKQISSELDKTSSVIFNISGTVPHYFRPPFGWESPWMNQVYHKKGYIIVKWSIDPKDWQHPSPGIIVNRILANLKKDAIILLHDGHQIKAAPNVQEMISALPVIIEELEARGFQFVTIDELLKTHENNIAISARHMNLLQKLKIL
jgi:peptidoglycan/xylan/chitin deacetylase (PgdA/CDA1 family)